MKFERKVTHDVLHITDVASQNRFTFLKKVMSLSQSQSQKVVHEPPLEFTFVDFSYRALCATPCDLLA